jgi:hypothetical protein
MRRTHAGLMHVLDAVMEPLPEGEEQERPRGTPSGTTPSPTASNTLAEFSSAMRVWCGSGTLGWAVWGLLGFVALTGGTW